MIQVIISTISNIPQKLGTRRQPHSAKHLTHPISMFRNSFSHSDDYSIIHVSILPPHLIQSSLPSTRSLLSTFRLCLRMYRTHGPRRPPSLQFADFVPKAICRITISDPTTLFHTSTTFTVQPETYTSCTQSLHNA